LGHYNILLVQSAQIKKTALKSNILALLQRTSTSDFSSAIRIFAPPLPYASVIGSGLIDDVRIYIYRGDLVDIGIIRMS
jgi:hypothetical protein